MSRALVASRSGRPAGAHLPAGTLRKTLHRHCPLRLQPDGGQRPGRSGCGPLAHTSRAGEGIHAAKQINQSLAFGDQGQQICRPGCLPELPDRHSRWLNKSLKARKPVFHKKTALAPARSWPHQEKIESIMTDTAAPAALPGQRENDPFATRRHSLRGHHPPAQRPLVRQHRLLKPPIAPPDRENQSVGGADVGITPLAVDSDGVEYQNPQGYGSALRKLRPLAKDAGAPDTGQPGLVGSPTPPGPGPTPGYRHPQQRPPPRQPRVGPQVPYPGYRDPQRIGHDQGRSAIQGVVRRRNVQPAGPDPVQGQLVRYRAVEADQWYPSSKTCSNCGVVNEDLGREREMELPQLQCPARPEPERSSQPA